MAGGILRTAEGNAGGSLRLPVEPRTVFVGDLHLGDGGRFDLFGPRDALFTRFLAEVATGYDAVVFTGDALDKLRCWRVGPILRAHAVAVEALRDLAASTRVIFLRGNHDWTVDYAAILPGVEVCERLHLGNTLIWHGHQLDPFNVPESWLYHGKAAVYHAAEWAVGLHVHLPLAEHPAWQNRLVHWAGYQYGRYLRRKVGLERRLGLASRAARNERWIRYWSRGAWGDPYGLFLAVRDILDRGEALEALVCGHTHLPGVVDLGRRRYVNVGSWTRGRAEYATWDGRRFEVRDYERGESLGDRHYQWMLDGCDPGDFFDWWRRHYVGWLRFRLPEPGRSPVSVVRRPGETC